FAAVRSRTCWGRAATPHPCPLPDRVVLAPTSAALLESHAATQRALVIGGRSRFPGLPRHLSVSACPSWACSAAGLSSSPFLSMTRPAQRRGPTWAEGASVPLVADGCS